MIKKDNMIKKLNQDCIKNGRLNVDIGTKCAVIFVLADWCGFCNRLKPEINNLLNRIDKKLHSIFVIKEEDSATMQKVQIKGFPTIYTVCGTNEPLQEYNESRDASSIEKYLRQGLQHRNK